jgi:hypothetical protein
VGQLHQVLAGNRYPGRGVLWARTLDGTLCGGYFLTGRSAASQARVLRRGDGELIVTPAGESEHDPLRHYVAARERSGWLVFGNGEQVAVVADRLEDGRLPAEALDGLEYELDPPIFTPRITVAVDLRSRRGAWSVSRAAAGGLLDLWGAARRDGPQDRVWAGRYRRRWHRDDGRGRCTIRGQSCWM